MPESLSQTSPKPSPFPKLDEIQVELSFMDSLEVSPPPEVSLANLESEVAHQDRGNAMLDEVDDAPAPPSGGAQVKLQLFGRPDDDLATLARAHYEKMENNPHFPRPTPSQMELERLLEDFGQDCKDTRNAMNHVRMLVAQKLKSR
eukprot:gene889-1117_t